MRDELARLERFFVRLNDGKLPKLNTKRRIWVEKHAAKLSLLAGLLSLYGAWRIWDWAHSPSIYSIFPSTDLSGGYYINSRYYAPGMDVWLWVGLVVLVVAAVMFYRAFRELKKPNKKGWDQAFYGGLLVVGYAILAILTGTTLSAWHIGLTIILAGLGLYGLFQIRSRFKAAA